MSTPLFPLAVWQSGTNENSIPANDNALRVQVLMGPATGVSNSEPVSPDEGEQFVVGTPWGGFTENNVVIYKGGVWLEWEAFEGWTKTIAGVLNYYDGADWVVGSGGSGIPDAPVDGTIYGREDGNWVPVPTGVEVEWGDIGGDISDQADLQNALDSKVNASALSAVATSGNVVDLEGFPGGDENFLRADGVFAPPPGSGPVSAEDVSYDNTASGLSADDVQGAIDEMASSVVAGAAPVVTLGGTSYTLDDLTNGAWHVFTNSSLVTITVMDDSIDPVAPNAEFGLDVTGAAGLVIVADNEADIDPPKGGTLTMEQGDFAVLKRRAADDYKLVGSTEDAP